MRCAAGRLATVALLLALVVAGLAPAAAGQSEAAATAMHVSLQPDGDARWTVSARFSLADANDTAAFERLADEYVSGQRDVLSADPYRAAAARASQTTGREMAVSNVTRSAGHDNGTGELRLSFTWTGFARVAGGGEQLVMGDVFTTPSGTWLPGLRAGQVLVISFPRGYAVESVSRGLDNGSIRVTGPASFEPGRPSATLQRSGSAPTSPGTPGAVVPTAFSVGAVLAILLLAGVLLHRYRRDEGEGETVAGAAAASDDEPPDDELLSDEERVLRLLRAEGGRMKQVDIVQETDWSNAKVSQLLSGMAESGRVEKLRIGRENLISLPDEDEE